MAITKIMKIMLVLAGCLAATSATASLRGTLTPTQLLSADRLISKGCGETFNNRCTPAEQSQVSGARRQRKETSQKIAQLKQMGCGFASKVCTKEQNIAVQDAEALAKLEAQETTQCPGGKTQFVQLRHGQKISKLHTSNDVVCSSGDVQVDDALVNRGGKLISFGPEFGNGEDFCNNCCRCKREWKKQCFFNKDGADFDHAQKCK
jgi:hypothetical protein